MNRKLLVALLLSVSLLSLGGFAVSGQDSTGNVPMFRGNPARTGEMPGPGPNGEQQLLWKYTTGGEVWSSPSVIDGVVYVGSDDGNLHAVDAVSGAQRWAFATGGGIWSSPVVVDGIVYVGSEDGNLYAVDAVSGAQRWAFATGGGIWSSPAMVDGIVYVGSKDGNLYAVDAVSGQELWTFATGDEIWSSSPAVVDGVVYVGSVDRKLYAVDAASGQQRWAFTTGFTVASSPAVVDGVVYFSGGDDNLYAVDAVSGQQRWAFTIGGFWSSPAVVNGIVYVGSEDPHIIYAVDATSGQQVWAFETNSSVQSSPVVVDGVVYVGSRDGNLYAVDALSGALRWAFSTRDGVFSALVEGVVNADSDDGIVIDGSRVDSSPAVIGSVVYVGSSDGNLYAIGNPPSAESRTATAEIQASATAKALATSIAIANSTATAIDIEQSWDAYFQSIDDTLSESANSLPGVTIEAVPEWCPEEQIPSNFQRCKSYPASFAGGSGETWTALAIYASNEEAVSDLEQMKGGLQRSGWQEQDIDGLDHDHICLTLVHDETSQGICYMTRDDALIVSYSYLDVDAPDAALKNAVDLAKLMNDAYDQADRPN